MRSRSAASCGSLVTLATVCTPNLTPGSFGVERQVELENVHPRLTKDPPLTPLGGAGYKVAHALLRETTSASYPRYLQFGIGWGDVGVKPRGRGCHRIDRHGIAGAQAIAPAVGGRPVTHSVDKCLIGRPKIRPT